MHRILLPQTSQWKLTRRQGGRNWQAIGFIVRWNVKLQSSLGSFKFWKCLVIRVNENNVQTVHFPKYMHPIQNIISKGLWIKWFFFSTTDVLFGSVDLFFLKFLHQTAWYEHNGNDWKPRNGWAQTIDPCLFRYSLPLELRSRHSWGSFLKVLFLWMGMLLWDSLLFCVARPLLFCWVSGILSLGDAVMQFALGIGWKKLYNILLVHSTMKALQNSCSHCGSSVGGRNWASVLVHKQAALVGKTRSTPGKKLEWKRMS